jgi:uncharacterized membrane protein
MSRYELYLFVHVAAAIIWVGGGAMLILLGIRAERSGEDARLKGVLDDIVGVSEKVIVPASLVVLVAGVLMVVDGPWAFDQLWIVLGLIGYLATAATGIGVLTPGSKRIDAMIKADGGVTTPVSIHETRKLLTLARVDVVTLFVVIADMVFKPTGDDAGLLIVMALVLVAGIAYIVSRIRALGQPGAPAAATT